MKVTEILDGGVQDVVKGILKGENPALGSSPRQPISKISIAQFPAERNAANDSTQDFNVNDLYKNGLILSAFNYAGRQTGDLRTFRSNQNNIGDYRKGVVKEAIANILMPRGQTDIDTINHKFNDVQQSLVERGNGSITGALSSMASHAVYGGLESITQGAFADRGEQVYIASRAMYAGAENRTKTYTWQLTPRNVYDLIEILKIYEMLSYYSYGSVEKSASANEIRKSLDEAYRETIINPLTPEATHGQTTMFERITSFLSNVNVVANPIIWTIRNFGQTSSFDARSDIFGPAQIQSIRFDKSPDGHFGGLAIAPNLPSSFVLEVTFREILALNRSDLYSED
ncbi:baseplate tail-tube junction protein [Aeromonas phage B614]|nr:baseplate tail-tube junction protein [Aeromonas phage B614]UYD58399.1 baseplate tail-tube junction protein [Aeromonas phage avDM14-QBC]UYD58615.1 baseplate tail-tube junction protein [Aeromonas phage avDM10-HWA]UYD59082.1 baseplate tail-tube junction protein [Aeromonas phage avDM7-IJDJ]UYD59894.1 baseplate tail-tube junction protein [Aeromonas phage avDM9-HANS]